MLDPTALGHGAPARFLLVALGQDRAALPGGRVRAILPAPPLTRLPGLPSAVAGLAPLRGAALPVLDLHRLLNRDGAPAGKPGRLVVADAGEPVGLLIDRVVGLSGGDALAGAGILDLPRLVAALALPASVIRPPPGRTAAATPEAAAEVALIEVGTAGRSYALPLAEVTEILALPPEGTSGRPAPGEMVRRGRILPLRPLAHLLGLEAEPGMANGRVVVARGVGIGVEAVGSVLRLPPGTIDPLPEVLRHGRSGAVAAVARRGEGDLLPVLSLDGLLAALGPETPAAALVEPPRVPPGETVVVVAVGDGRYGLPSGAVSAIRRVPAAITRLPWAPAGVAGLIDLRGAAIPVIDLRGRLGQPAGAADARARILILGSGEQRAGLRVDGILGRRALPPGAVRPPPEGLDAAVTRAADLGAGELLPLLDPERLLAPGAPARTAA